MSALKSDGFMAKKSQSALFVLNCSTVQVHNSKAKTISINQLNRMTLATRRGYR